LDDVPPVRLENHLELGEARAEEVVDVDELSSSSSEGDESLDDEGIDELMQVASEFEEENHLLQRGATWPSATEEQVSRGLFMIAKVNKRAFVQFPLAPELASKKLDLEEVERNLRPFRLQP